MILRCESFRSSEINNNSMANDLTQSWYANVNGENKHMMNSVDNEINSLNSRIRLLHKTPQREYIRISSQALLRRWKSREFDHNTTLTK